MGGKKKSFLRNAGPGGGVKEEDPWARRGGKPLC